jgi:hypothetical protein
MAKRFYVEQRASKSHPWQFVDIAAGLEAGPISIHRTKRQAERARDDHKAMLRRDARMERARANQRMGATNG